MLLFHLRLPHHHCQRQYLNRRSRRQRTPILALRLFALPLI